MNPYTKDVINATLPLMQQQNALSQNQGANQANSANAFGGSRQGIQQGVAQAQGAMNIGQMAAQLNQANFGQAQAAATGDINRNLQAQTTNQQSQQTDLARQNTDLLANQGANAADLNRSLSAQTANQGAQQAEINSDIQASQGTDEHRRFDEQGERRQLRVAVARRRGPASRCNNRTTSTLRWRNSRKRSTIRSNNSGHCSPSLGMTPKDTSTSSQNTSQTTTRPRIGRASSAAGSRTHPASTA